jgi:uncharacterized protein YigA (DUF484 family)
MTRKDFEIFRMAIEDRRCSADSLDPISFGIQRAKFEVIKYQRLIAAARGIAAKTVQARIKPWQRQLAHAHESRERFEELERQVLQARTVRVAARVTMPVGAQPPA